MSDPGGATGADAGTEHVAAVDQDADPSAVAIEVDEADNGERQPADAGSAGGVIPARRQAEELEGHSEPAGDTD